MSALPKPTTPNMRQIESREWSLSWAAIAVTLLLTAGLTSFALGIIHPHSEEAGRADLVVAIRGLVGLVFVFDLYVVYQQLQITRMRRRLLEREEFFNLISENVVDMIAVVDSNGKRISTARPTSGSWATRSMNSKPRRPSSKCTRTTVRS